MSEQQPRTAAGRDLMKRVNGARTLWGNDVSNRTILSGLVRKKVLDIEAEAAAASLDVRTLRQAMSNIIDRGEPPDWLDRGDLADAIIAEIARLVIERSDAA